MHASHRARAAVSHLCGRSFLYAALLYGVAFAYIHLIQCAILSFILFYSLALFLLSPLFRILFQQLLEHYTQRSVEKLHCFPFVCSEISDTQLYIKLKSSLESFAVPCSIHSIVVFFIYLIGMIGMTPT